MVKTLSHDRDIEWGWLSLNLMPAAYPDLAGYALDFGPMPPTAPTSKLALDRGYFVIAVGLEDITLLHLDFLYVRQDINTLDRVAWPKFDLIINISTTEHVGLERYGDPPDPDGDLKAMRRLRDWMRPDARHILTVPIGVDAVVGHYHRVYGRERLPQLLEGYRAFQEAYWRKTDADKWSRCSKEEALAEQPTLLPVESPLYLYYAIGGFVLGRL